MNKIKKFKIKPHLKDIVRRIYKAGPDLKTAALDNEADLNKFILNFAKTLNGGVIYQYFDGKNQALADAGVTHEGGFSACVVTLGKEIEADMELTKDNFTLQTVKGVCFADFLRSAVNFTADLIKDQAEKEEFEATGFEVLCSPAFSYGPEPKFLREALKVEAEIAGRVLPPLLTELNCEKIDVKFENGAPSPKGTIVFLVPWNKKKKRKK